MFKLKKPGNFPLKSTLKLLVCLYMNMYPRSQREPHFL